MTDKQQVFRLVQKEYSFLSKIRFHHVWIHIKTEAGRKDNYENYMFTKLEGTLWVREAFLKAQYHGPQVYRLLSVLISLVIGTLSIVMVLINQKEVSNSSEKWEKWIITLPSSFWVYTIMLVFNLTYFSYYNFLFLNACV